MNRIKILSMVLILAALTSCRPGCGCPMASSEQKNTTNPTSQIDGIIEEAPLHL